MKPTQPLLDLPWESRFVARFPGDPEAGNFTRQVKDIAYSEVRPTPVSNPKLAAWSDELARELGVTKPTDPQGPEALVLGGNSLAPDMRPYAARYGGHQFGNWAGQLGDGRAITLGEAITAQGRMEFQLKGAGPTPYSRRADGRAVLRSSLREFLCSEAMYFLGVPTTRALSLVTTGDSVLRDMFYDGNAADEPGAIVCRVAPSFVRFGNFEILAAHEEYGLLKDLADYVIEHFYPEIDRVSPDAYGLFFDRVAERTALMITEWMRVGFVHGVMNTDNMSILGVTIDYGPYGWLDPYDPDWTPNTTDAQGRRYRFGHQPQIALWNLARLGEALYPLIRDEPRLHRSLDRYREIFSKAHGEMIAAKLGLRAVEPQVALDLVSLLSRVETDMTIFYRGLCDWQPGQDLMNEVVRPAIYSSQDESTELRQGWTDWSARYATELAANSVPDRASAMKRVNPKYVPRNYLAQNAIKAAEKGDFTVLERLMRVLRRPYDDQPGEDDLAARRPDWARTEPGCSALSCSS